MVKIKGIKSYTPRVVDLSKFFDKPTTVTVRPLPPPSRAEIQELTTEGMRYATTQRKKTLDIDAIEQAMPAAVTMEVRSIKLRDGVIANTIEAEDDKGERQPWNQDLWDSLDEADPRILEKVLDAINDETYPEEEGADPTSAAAKEKK